MCNKNLLNIKDTVPFIKVENEELIEVNRQFLVMTEFTHEELKKRKILDVFRRLRVGPNVDVEKIDEGADYFLFTKSLEVKFVNIKVLIEEKGMTYFFIENSSLDFGTKFRFLNELFLDNYYGIGIYSVPDGILLKANDKYIDIFDEPYNKKENCIGKRRVEFEPNFIGSTFEEIWNKVLETGESFNMNEFMYEGLCRGTTYWKMSIYPIFEENKMKYLFIMSNEITKEVLNRKKLEEQANIIIQKNRQLEEQKKELQAIINNMGDLLFVLNSKGDYIYENKLAGKYNIRRILEKYGSDKNINQFFDINRNAIPIGDAPFMTVLRTKETDKRIIILKSEEKEIYLQTTTVPVLDCKGNIDMVISIATDVTGHIKHSKIILQQKEELETVVENMSEGLVVVNKNGKYIRVNKKVKEQAVKLTESGKVMSIVGESFDLGDKYYNMSGQHISRDDFPTAKVTRGEKIENERVVVKRGDKAYYFDFSGNPIFDDNGEVRLGVILIKDVTQQVSIQNLITEQKEQLQAVIENINEAIFVYDKDSKLCALNKLAKDYFPNEDLKQYADGYSYTKFFYLDNSEIPNEEMPFSKVRAGQHVNNYRAKMVQGDNVRYINVSGSPVYRLDKSFALSVISCRDITAEVNKERIIKEQQELILKKDKEQIADLKSLLDMKDEFLSFVSHEFKTPLNVINSAIQAMNYFCGNELSDKGKKYLGMIKQNTLRQIRLVNNLLDITRTDAGRIKINKKNLDIVFLTKAITESVYSYASNKGVKLTFTSSAKKKIIAIDDEKYERILLNLLSNAIKFTPQGKNIIVSLASVKDKVSLKIKDTGIGIPLDKLDVIFERFGQVDSLLSRQAEGTGIGLSLVKRFVEALGGSISVKSKVGVGTTFAILLPNEKILEKDNEIEMISLMDNRLIETTSIEFSDIYL